MDDFNRRLLVIAAQYFYEHFKVVACLAQIMRSVMKSSLLLLQMQRVNKLNILRTIIYSA